MTIDTIERTGPTTGAGQEPDRPPAADRPGRPAPATRWARRLAERWKAARTAAADAGMSTAEYAVGTVAACSFGVVLYKVVTSSAVSAALAGMVRKALDVAF